jgi:hypothetical protein
MRYLHGECAAKVTASSNELRLDVVASQTLPDGGEGRNTYSFLGARDDNHDPNPGVAVFPF